MQHTTDIDGAPYKIGQKVTVTGGPHATSFVYDETLPVHLLGQVGVVKYFNYDCGCGQSFPDDPMIGIQFAGGLVEEFWKEEVEVNAMGKERKIVVVTPKAKVKVNVGKTDGRAASTLAALIGLILDKKVTVEDRDDG